MLRSFLSVDKSSLVALVKKGLLKTSLMVTIGMVSLSVTTGIIPFTVAGVSNQETANAQWRPNNPGVYACNSYSNGNCMIYKSNVTTWVGSIANNECKKRHGQFAIAQRTFVPYVFACLAPTNYV